jgi:hypothetical protein
VPQYDIFVLCTECGALHPMGVRVHLDVGPEAKQNIPDTFKEKSRPPQIVALEGHKTLCLKTGRLFVQENDDRVFLIPSELSVKKVAR